MSYLAEVLASIPQKVLSLQQRTLPFAPPITYRTFESFPKNIAPTIYWSNHNLDNLVVQAAYTAPEIGGHALSSSSGLRPKRHMERNEAAKLTLDTREPPVRLYTLKNGRHRRTRIMRKGAIGAGGAGQMG
jgi:hypothetical protein